MRHRWRAALPILSAAFLLVTWFLFFHQPGVAAPNLDPVSGRIHPGLAKALLSSGPGDFLKVIVQWESDASVLTLERFAGDPETRRRQVVSALQAETAEKSRGLTSFLRQAESAGEVRNVKIFWASPVVSLEATPAAIYALAKRNDVFQVRLDERIYLPPEPELETLPRSGEPDSWNLSTIHVELAEKALGLNGEGVVVANLDSGVDWQHPALLKKYRGYREGGLPIHAGNWFVATDETYLYPGDGFGHGTRTMGVIVGDDEQGNRIGVAPAAQWIAVKIFSNQGFTYESWIHSGLQWVLAPDGDPALAPDVVNNSWGTNAGSDERFRSDLAALRASGIYVVFAAGNYGPAKGTVGSPASFSESMAVGAIDEDLAVAAFSSRGPSPWGDIKPEIVAPGVAVRTTSTGGGYALSNGTSFAAPHVAGVVTLLLQADPTLTPDQIDDVLINSARSIGETIPNNNSGWGLVDAYAAGLMVTSSGELSGQVRSATGSPLPYPMLMVTPRNGSHPIEFSGDVEGQFILALTPGLYDVTASVFGYAPETKLSVKIDQASQALVQFNLDKLPTGSLSGVVRDADTGQPISATLKLVDEAVEIQTGPVSGTYTLVLPGGAWPIDVWADSHRVGHITPTVVAGESQIVDIQLNPAPRILLIDSGRWYYQSRIAYFEDALQSLDYVYRLRPVKDPFGDTIPGGDAPTAEELNQYQVVIWSAPLDSPAFIRADPAIYDFLSHGGKLILSGQDTAFWDAGGNIFLTSAYFPEFFRATFGGEGNQGDLRGVEKTPLQGITVTLNTDDSARQQFHPDNVLLLDSLVASPTLEWEDQTIGGLIAGGCQPYRVGWFGFGLEGSGPRPVRVAILDQLLQWFEIPPPDYGIATDRLPDPLIGLAGSVVSQTWRVNNTGVLTESFRLDLNPGPWPLSIQLPDGRQVTSDTVFTLPGCSAATFKATVAIPPGLPRDQVSISSIDFISQSSPSVSDSLTLTAKTPATVLFVDDERWTNYEDRFLDSLTALGQSFDVFTTDAGRNPPLPETLSRYPLVIWSTGQDWFEPLSSKEEQLLSAYLEGGGGLLLSSQDFLDDRGIDDFAYDKLGVDNARLTITTTQVFGDPLGPLGGDLGPWELDYPYYNWSDGVTPRSGTLPLLLDRNLNTVGVGRPAGIWRTAFFPFSLEALSPGDRNTLMEKTLFWLSPVGESKLKVPPVVSGGDRIPLRLTLSSAFTRTLNDVQVSISLPGELSLVPGSLLGHWRYDLLQKSLFWVGSLQPGHPVLLEGELEVGAGLPPGAVIPLEARFTLEDSSKILLPARIEVGNPRVTVDKTASSGEVFPGDVVGFEIWLNNEGVAASTVVLTDSIPAGISLITPSLATTGGSVLVSGGVIHWSGDLSPQSTVAIYYEGVVQPWNPGEMLVNWADVEDVVRKRSSWSRLSVKGRLFLPVIWR